MLVPGHGQPPVMRPPRVPSAPQGSCRAVSRPAASRDGGGREPVRETDVIEDVWVLRKSLAGESLLARPPACFSVQGASQHGSRRSALSTCLPGALLHEQRGGWPRPESLRHSGAQVLRWLIELADSGVHEDRGEDAAGGDDRRVW